MKCEFTLCIEHPAMDGDEFNQMIAVALHSFAKKLETTVIPAIGCGTAEIGDHNARLTWGFTIQETHQ